MHPSRCFPMPTPSKPPGEKAIEVANGPLTFRWQMFFNAFTIERLDYGIMLRVAYVLHGSASEIVPIIISNEGIAQLKESSKEYIRTFGSLPPRPDDQLPPIRQFSPYYANFVRLAKMGASAECAFFTIPIYRYVDAAKEKVTNSMNSIPVALLHSDLNLHEHLVLQLLNNT